MDLSVLLIILQLIYLEGILSVDNAAILGAMVAPLPSTEAIPWPRLLRFIRTPAHNILGGQRTAALKVGLLGAYLGRGVMLLLASSVMQNRWLLLAGGLYLIKLATGHLGEPRADTRIAGGPAAGRPIERGFWIVVLTLELADLVFSLDNVVAAVALSRQMWVVLTGVFLGIVTMRFAAGVFSRLIQRYPVMEAAAYLLLLIIGVELLLEHLWGIDISDTQRFVGSLGTLTLCLVYGQLSALQRIGRSMRWVRRGLGFVDQLFAYALAPAAWAMRGLIEMVRAIFSIFAERRQRALPTSATGTDTRVAARRRTHGEPENRVP